MMSKQWTEVETSQFILIQDGASTFNVHYNDIGQGERVVVMLHGSGPGTNGWANFNRNIQPLTDAGYRVILMDCPGWGKSDTVLNDSGSRSDFNARILKGLVDALDLSKISLVGNSMGAHSVVAFTLAYPDLVDKQILMGGGTGGGGIFTLKPAEGIKRINQLYREPNLENLQEMMNIFVYDSSRLTEEMFTKRFESILLRQDHLDNFVQSIKANPKQFPDVSYRLPEIAHETLIIWGRDDRFVPMDTALILLNGLQRAELHIFNRCGHWAQWEYADKFNRMTLDFLEHGIC